MAVARRILERATPRSAFSLTLLTFAAIFLVVGLFVQDLQLISVDGERDDSGLLCDRALTLRAGESYRSGPVDEELNLPLDIIEDDPVESAWPEAASTTKLAMNTSVQPSHRRANHLPLSANLSPGYVALLRRTCDCRWAENQKNLAEGTQFKVGQTINIAAGLAEVVFGCGATAVVEGPAVLELQSSKTSSLRTGKLTANVPDDVEGFTVHTPTAQLVSLCKLEQKAVAKLTGMAECLWAEGNSVTKQGACLLPGQAVKLAGGLAEITFACGAKVILQGPASLEIESSKTATLHNGRMTADVPDDLEGFKIHTAVAEVLSLPANQSPEKKEPKTDAAKK